MKNMIVLGANIQLRTVDSLFLGDDNVSEVELVTYKTKDNYLLAIIDGKKVGVVKFDDMYSTITEDVAIDKNQMHTFATAMGDAVEAIDFKSDEGCKEGAQLLSKTIGPILKEIDAIYDVEYKRLIQAKVIINEAANRQVARKMVYRSPLVEMENTIRRAIEDRDIQRELEASQSQVTTVPISQEILQRRMDIAIKDDNEDSIEEIIDLMDNADNLQTTQIVIGNKKPDSKKFDLGTGVSVSHKLDFEIVDESEISREYMMPNVKKIRASIKVMKSDEVRAKIGAGVKLITKSISRFTIK